MKKKYNLIAWLAVITGGLAILCPLLIYRENYIFAIHDYLDCWPALFEVLRRSGLFFSPDSSMPIMGGISTCYLYFDFGAYRLLNFLFGSIWGEIANKMIGIVVGLYFARRFFSIIANENSTRLALKYEGSELLSSDEWLPLLLAGAYAFSAVYPNWTISFAFLPLYMEMLYKIIKEEDKFKAGRAIAFFLFGFFIYFPCIGIFLFGFYMIAFIVDVFHCKKIKKSFLIYVVLMLASIAITNLNVFIYVLRGDELNRTLIPMNLPANFREAIKSLISISLRVGISGQYHAAPVLRLLIPVCVFGYALLFFQLLRKNELKKFLFPTIIIAAIITLCMMYALDAMNILGYVISKVIPFLSGFNFGRVVYFNNILWYILAIHIFTRLDRNKLMNFALFLILVVNIGVVITTPGYYRETSANILHSRSLENGKVTFAQFYDTEYFDSLKEDIEYNNEGVLSVGYHPSIAMFNGFNTMDGYMSTNPLDYHYSFREIIAPTLDRYPAVAEYYDEWGGRLYCYVDDSMDVEPEVFKGDESRELLIDTAAFYDKGGRYILSKYKLDNAEELGLFMIEHKTDIESSIYQIWVYEMRRSE